MFRRVLYENWHDVIPIVAFVLTFAVFLIALIRALLMRKDTVVAMSLLPLDDAPVAPVAPVPANEGADSAVVRHEHCQGNCTGCGCSRTK